MDQKFQNQERDSEFPNPSSTSTDDELWFKAKRFGWGWTPSNWRGWLVIILAFAIIGLFALNTDFENEFEIVKFFIKEGAVIGLLIWVCWKKGEKPRWRWRK